ncbi:hypothetical protein BGZ93_003195 [Podila epicladia]|nr:hypothetical protein BGZ93_003195 [Podila epicladia]
MMEAFAAVVEHFGLQRKVMSITSDNASNVKKMMQELATMMRDKNGEWLYLGRMGYVLQHPNVKPSMIKLTLKNSYAVERMLVL